MQKIDELVAEMQNAILESDEYKEYKEMEEMIKRNPDLKRTVDEFRKCNFELQCSEEHSDDMLRESHELNKRFESIRYQEVVNRYLHAEICLSHLVRDICMSIVDVVNFDMDFLS